MTVARGWVLLATDTGAGKTTLGCALAAALTQNGQRVAVRKPVETGCSPVLIETGEQPVDGAKQPADGLALWRAAGQIEPLEQVCPLRFFAPRAAPEAARMEGRSLRFSEDFAAQLPPQAHSAADVWLIETAGGLCSPLAEDALNLDLARHTGLPVLLIAPDRLGSLSALFSALMVLRAAEIPVAAIALNQTDTRAPEAPDNLGALRDWLPRLWPAPLPAIVHIPWQSPDAGSLLCHALHALPQNSKFSAS